MKTDAPWWQVSFWSNSPVAAELVGAVVLQADCLERAIHAARDGAPELRWCAAMGSALPERVVGTISPDYHRRLLSSDESFWLTRHVTARLTRLRARAGDNDKAHAVGGELAEVVDVSKLRTQLEPSEEAPLRWYWSDGVTLSERSTMGAMVENHAIYSEEAIEYENDLRAGRASLKSGVTFDRLGWDPVEYGRAGREAVREAVFDRDGNYKGERFTGHYRDTRVRVTNARAGDVYGLDEEDQETARIMAEYVSPRGHEQNGEAIIQRANISHVLRAMMVMPEHDGLLAYDVMRVVHGPDGERWHRLQTSDEGGRAYRSHGRIAALYPSTRAGRRLLTWDDELKHDSGQPLSDEKTQTRMEELVEFAGAAITEENWKKPTVGRYAGIKQAEARKIVRQMLDVARSEANVMYWRACHAWRAALKEHGAKVVKRGKSTAAKK